MREVRARGSKRRSPLSGLDSVGDRHPDPGPEQGPGGDRGMSGHPTPSPRTGTRPLGGSRTSRSCGSSSASSRRPDDAISDLGDCLKAWSPLQVERPQFYAGLAAILTAGSGLGWNRALIFRNLQVPASRRLVYAVGAGGEGPPGPTGGSTDRARPHRAGPQADRRPRPHGPTPWAGRPADSLYEIRRRSRPPPDLLHRRRQTAHRTRLWPGANGGDRVPYLPLDRGDELICPSTAATPACCVPHHLLLSALFEQERGRAPEPLAHRAG